METKTPILVSLVKVVSRSRDGRKAEVILRVGRNLQTRHLRQNAAGKMVDKNGRVFKF